MNKLASIVDRKKPFTMIYSGVESETYFKILYDLGIRDFLMSYHYLKGIDFSKRFEGLNIKVFIDSGAFTYQNDDKYLDYTVEQWEEVIESYLSWARKNKEHISAIANMDLENLVGVDKVKEWNEKYFEPFMIETKIPVCFIWHQISGYTDWEKYCQRYPYVGFSWVADNTDASEGAKLIKIAEKYNAVVHGMGMTRTALLPKLPFYTSDSTTWLVGLQYGEVNYWRGTRMSRLKKEQWKGEYLERIVNELSEYNIDKDKLMNEDTTEMIRVNVIAFIEACKYINERLRTRMYWLKESTAVNDLDDESLYPPLDWLKGETDFNDWEEYAESLNITTELGDNFSIDAITDCTCFIKWEDPLFADFIKNAYSDKVIKDLHDLYVNQIVLNDDERIEELREFFSDVVTGKSDKLLNWGIITHKAIERDEYLEDDEYDLIDIPEEEVSSALAKILPKPEKEEDAHPDITEMDDEIFKDLDIEPVRDDKGRFLKGQRKVKKPKNIYSEKYPKLACDTCYAGQTCPEFKAGMVCMFNRMFKRFDTRDMGDIIEAMQSMVGLNLERMQRAVVFETLDGGIPNGVVTSMIDQNMRLLGQLKQMYEFGSPEVLKQTKVVKADGSQETTTEVNSGGGILEKLFSGAFDDKKDVPKDEDIIDVEAEEVKE